MRVLVVEDERGLADDIAEGLRDNGLAVDVTYDGLDAARKISLYPYDVIVLDRDLPGVHGDSICRLAADTDNPAMILMLTAAGSPRFLYSNDGYILLGAVISDVSGESYAT